MNYFLPYGHRLGCLYSFILLVYGKPILHLFIFLLFSGHFFSFVVYEYLNTKSTLLKPNVLLAFVLGEIKVKTCQANLSSTECPPPKKKNVSFRWPTTLHGVKTQMRASLWKYQYQSMLSQGHCLLSKLKPRSLSLLWVASGSGFLYICAWDLFPLFSERREKKGGTEKKEKGKEKEDSNTLYTEVCQDISAIYVMLRISQITGMIFGGLSQKHFME